MKQFAKILCAILAVSKITSLACEGGTPESLEQRINRGDVRAFMDAGDLGRKDLIPALEPYAGDESWARAALAKLGVKKYLDAILLEATGLTNRVVYREGEKYTGSSQDKYETLWVQMEAFKKLAYIKDRSTVKTLIAFLDIEENPEDYVQRGGKDIVRFERPSNAAMRILPQIVDNPPAINLQGTNDTHEARVKLWQQWWEQNKAKYP
jgi:hypothetical protein